MKLIRHCIRFLINHVSRMSGGQNTHTHTHAYMNIGNIAEFCTYKLKQNYIHRVQEREGENNLCILEKGRLTVTPGIWHLEYGIV